MATDFAEVAESALRPLPSLAAGELAATHRLEPVRPAELPAEQPGSLQLDLAALVLGVLVALRGQTHTGLVTGLLLAGVYPAMVLGLLRRRLATWEDGSLLDELRQLVSATATSAVALIGIDAIASGQADVPLGLRIWVCTFALLVIGRMVLYHVRGQLLATTAQRTLIVGAGRVGGDVARRLASLPRHGLRPIGFLEYQPAPPGVEMLDLPLLGTPDELTDAIERSRAECVVFAFPGGADQYLVPLLEECEQADVRTFVVPRMFEAVGWRMSVRQVGSMPLGEFTPVTPRAVRFSGKHLIDRVIAGLVLAVLAPVLATIALLVRAGSPGPAFFSQRRVGRDGREFEMLKFRTMREPPAVREAFVPLEGLAPGGVELEDRRTPLGLWLRRTSLDELPQLINVLRGDMSLVGPRPERPEYARMFGAELSRYERRHKVKSGITGLAQVNGLRGQTSIAERAEYDNFYVQNWSFWLDVKIALRTVKVVLSLRGE